MPTYIKRPARFVAFQFDPNDPAMGLSAAAAWLTQAQVDVNPVYRAQIRAAAPEDGHEDWRWVVTQVDTAGSPENPNLAHIDVGDWIVIQAHLGAWADVISDYTFRSNYALAD